MCDQGVGTCVTRRVCDFQSFDLITLVLKLGLDIVEMYV